MIVVFEKGFTLRHIGHLDLMRTMQRALRRTDLPIQYSNGFNPHIQLSFAAPLSVGVVGLRELMDVPVAGEFSPQQFVHELNAVLPACLQVKHAYPVQDDYPALMALVAGSSMRIEIEDSPDSQRITDAFARFMAAKECVTLRKTKSGENMTNIRPFIAQAELKPSPTGMTITCVILNRHEGSLKPAVLMQALCEIAQIDSVPFIAYREQIYAQSKTGELIRLEDYTHV